MGNQPPVPAMFKRTQVGPIANFFLCTHSPQNLFGCGQGSSQRKGGPVIQHA